MRLGINIDNCQSFVRSSELKLMAERTETAAQQLLQKTGAGNDFLGWLDLPERMLQECDRIKTLAQKVRDHSEVLVVVGIGGSYLGAKSALHFLKHHFYNELSAEKRGGPAIYFAGINLSTSYLKDLMDLIGDRDFSLNVISKSGTTTEPAVSFRFLMEMMEQKYTPDQMKDRIFLTTDPERGALTAMSKDSGYEKMVIDPSVGGRYSVLSPVGLFPLAVAGVDIKALLQGALEAKKDCLKPFDQSHCKKYAALRNILYQKGFQIEMLVNYEPRFQYIAEWWKQLYGESEGKDGKGIFPASASYTADLHSLGQYVQDGRRHLFETILMIEKESESLLVKSSASNLDNLNYLEGKSMEYINQKAMEGTLEAHVSGGVPNLIIQMGKADEIHLGALFYFFEFNCGLSAYLLGVNPFDQPGVEEYKKNMFRLLEKPGH